MSHLKKDNSVMLCEGGGFQAFWYSLGRGSILQKHMHSVYGYSSGAIVAAIICSLPHPICFETVVTAAIRAKYTVAPSIGKIELTIENFLDRILPSNAHILCSGRCHIILCDPKKMFYSKIVNSWTSRKELIRCVIASAYVPFIVGNFAVEPCYSCIDGWMSIDLRKITDGMITISDRDNKVNMMDHFFHISIAEAFKLFEQGFNS